MKRFFILIFTVLALPVMAQATDPSVLKEREETEENFRTEFSYGSFHRAIAVPRGTTAEDVTATYKDGVLEVRLPIRKAETQVAKVPITKT